MFTKKEESNQEGLFFAENGDGAVLLVTGTSESFGYPTWTGVLVKEGKSPARSNVLGRYSSSWNQRRFKKIRGELKL